MKKKIWIPITIVVLLAILAVPIPTGVCKDGGTREYTALTYKIVKWNRLTVDSAYRRTKVYFFPQNFQSVDSLWALEEDEAEYSLKVRIVEISGETVTANPCDPLLDTLVSFSRMDLPLIGAQVGSVVQVTYKGGVMETYPAQLKVIRWEMVKQTEEPELWLDKSVAEKYDHNIFNDIRITKIEEDCFYAVPVIPMPYVIKLNGRLSEEWCVGDQVICTYENTYYDRENQRVEADMLTVEASDWQPDPNASYKPVIYLYPEKETEVSVQLVLNGKLTCTYPAYGSGWTVTASPDGTLTDAKGQTYNYLYWEGVTYAQYDFSKGFCIKSEDTAAFLEDALDKLGLTRREANEFIVYWLPQMEQNPYNIISFQTDIYTDAAQLAVDPAPDTLIRVFMAWQPTDTSAELPEQELSAPERTGFTVVEWGGTQVQ